MKREKPLEWYTDLQREDLDMEWFGAALAVQHLRQLIRHGGTVWGRVDDEDGLTLEQVRRVVRRAIVSAEQTKRFAREWHQLQTLLPLLEEAWNQGQAEFQEALTHASKDPEEMESFSQGDMALDCFAVISARERYPNNKMLQAWFVRGYMLAWNYQFGDDDEDAMQAR